ncbi:EpsD family peptidyl-prolyl cis-trans isomerase [Roseateles sp. BYS180W]
MTANSPSLLKVSVIALALTLTACGKSDGEKKASQTAVRVNSEEVTVHQINYVLQRQQGIRPEQQEAATKQILERLIDQELAVQKAQDLKLDRDSNVVQQVEYAKREILARAYAEKISQSASKPSADEVTKYYDANPALFKERRVYNFQEIGIEANAEKQAAVRDKLRQAKSIQEFVEYLKAEQIRFGVNQTVRPAEQLPLSSVESMSRLKDGDSIVNSTANGLQVLHLAASKVQSITLEQAKPAIEQFLLNQRKGELMKADIKQLRDSAKIEYIGKFKENASAAPGAEAPAKAQPAAPVASAPKPNALDADAVSKGLGIK